MGRGGIRQEGGREVEMGDAGCCSDGSGKKQKLAQHEKLRT